MPPGKDDIIQLLSGYITNDHLCHQVKARTRSDFSVRKETNSIQIRTVSQGTRARCTVDSLPVGVCLDFIGRSTHQYVLGTNADVFQKIHSPGCEIQGVDRRALPGNLDTVAGLLFQ